MADTSDVQNYGRKFQNQLEKVREAAIADADREAILRFVRRLDAQGEVNEGTMISYLNRLRLSSERADGRLVDMRRDDVDALLFALNHDHGLSEGTVRNYRKALRVFFDRRGEDWADDITVGAPPTNKVDPNDLLENDEIEAMLDASANPRDKAVIAMLADTGLRIGAVTSLRIKDVDMQGRAATVTINENGNVKGASGTVPLTWSEGYVGNYLDVHPRRDEPDAALIHKTRGWHDGDDDGALTYQYVSSRIKTIADRAGVARDRVNTHNFRKTAISNWIRAGLDEQSIKHRATWDVDSSMIKVYSGVRDSEQNDAILDHYGIAEGERETERPSLDQCPRCRTSVKDGMHYCPSCSAALTSTAADRLDTIRAEKDADMVDADARAEREAVATGGGYLEDERVGLEDGHDESSQS